MKLNLIVLLALYCLLSVNTTYADYHYFRIRPLVHINNDLLDEPAPQFIICTFIEERFAQQVITNQWFYHLEK